MFKVAETLKLNYITSKFIQDPDAFYMIQDMTILGMLGTQKFLSTIT
jgi:hypothetical protein